jgi:putative transposase
VEKRNIFEDSQDYNVFLSYLREYLTTKNLDILLPKLQNLDTPWSEKNKILRLINLNNFHDEISLLAYCLMPNHFHFLVRQSSANSIDRFINSLNTRYVMYFNKKYKRVGPLFQDVYKAVLVKTDEQLLYLSIYIHNNPKAKGSIQSKERKGDAFRFLTSQPSSIQEYLGLRKTSWINYNTILTSLSTSKKSLSYKNLVMSNAYTSSQIDNLTID